MAAVRWPQGFLRLPGGRISGPAPARAEGERRGVANAQRRGPVWQPAESRTVITLGALWLLVALLAVRQAAAVLRLPPEERLTDLATWIGENGVLRAGDPLYDTGSFTGTPFAGLVFTPLTRAAEQSLGVVWTFGTLLLVAALGMVTARMLPGPSSRRAALFAVPAVIGLLVLSVPVRNTFALGQTGIVPVLLVLVAFLPRCSARTTGLLTGAAAALQPTVLLFAPLLWLTGRRRAAAVAAGTFAGCSALAWAAAPDDSWAYWLHHVAGAGLGAPADDLANQSLHGVLLRLGLQGPVEVVLFLALAAAVAVLGLRRAARYAADGQWLLAVALTGCVAVAVSPTAWQHQQLWILLAAVGRVGRRGADRLVWPVLVILVMTMHRDALMPNLQVVGFLGDNAPLFAALAAACAVPFLTRDVPEWRRPVPTSYATVPASRLRHVPLLRFWKQPLSRPNLVLELLLIRVGYWVYSYIRSQAPDGRALAEGHGWQILDIEAALRIDIEHWFNQVVARTGWLEAGMNFYYTTFHFLVPLSLLGWMYLRRPVMYRWARTSLAVATLLALIGFWAYPLAPPRLMPGLGFIDTAHGPQDLSNPDFGALTGISNQYAAMPSLHVGWSLWCAVVVWRLAPAWWGKLLGVLYPVLTTAVIVGTANHYLLDAAGGAVVVAAGFGLRHVLAGRTAEDRAPGDHRAAGERAAGDGTPDRTAKTPVAEAPAVEVSAVQGRAVEDRTAEGGAAGGPGTEHRPGGTSSAGRGTTAASPLTAGPRAGTPPAGRTPAGRTPGGTAGAGTAPVRKPAPGASGPGRSPDGPVPLPAPRPEGDAGPGPGSPAGPALAGSSTGQDD
ncbi:DUF2029 domain-containing protein [Streptomyces lycii]|uniref:DUF2029 domain-containing protein n=1 Tax=Streptomyces lycii TaxID=2654337 RepID=A0ABQ7F959_9ACTN|nr:DUF2029 domain-containing protein [Streptomyces lycii]